jgi:hypothetical protein
LIDLGKHLKRKVQYVKQRENKFWFAELEAFTKVSFTAQLIALVQKFGQTKYTSLRKALIIMPLTRHEVDQVYRKFIYNYRKTSQNKILADLSNKVEKVYSNDWLLIYNNNWQSIIDKLTSWPNDTRTNQQSL